MHEPVAKRVAHVWRRPTGDVDDPWAWLADRDDPDTLAYLRAENDAADAWFAEHGELVDAVYGELRSRIQETDQSPPVRHGRWWYTSSTMEGADYPVHRRGPTAETADRDVLLDENVEATGHPFFALGAFDLGHDQQLLAWSADLDGSERYTMRIRDLRTGRDLDDVLEGTAGAGTAWAAGDHHLFYVTDDEHRRPCRVWRHERGTPQAADVLVFEEPDEHFSVGIDLSRSGQWILIDVESQTTSETRLIRADEPERAPQIVRPRRDGIEFGVDHWGDRFVIVTNEVHPDFAVMTAPLDDPGRWTTLVAGSPGRRILGVEPFAEHVVLVQWRAAQPELCIVGRDGTERVLQLSDEPHDVALDANPEYDSTTVRYLYQSYTVPAEHHAHDLRTDERTLLKRTAVVGVDLSRYVAERHWATAPDGVAVPVDVVRRADAAQPAPTVLYGYGSYEISLAPWFSPARLSLLDRGISFAVAHPRGGGELGRQWYLDGKLLHKRNTFTDTIAAAEHLVATGLARPGRLAVRGASAGGLLVGACVTMRPDLFAAAVAEVPFVDVVTTMSDPDLPLTVTEWEEWGDPRIEPWATYMLGYSPYDQTSARDYPALMVTGGLNDPAVSYHEPAKWVAKLRALRTNDAPLVFRCELGAGHRGPSGRYDAWRDEARVVAFLLVALAG